MVGARSCSSCESLYVRARGYVRPRSCHSRGVLVHDKGQHRAVGGGRTALMLGLCIIFTGLYLV